MSDLAHPVRVRFAPSPTGEFHVGGARSALSNWVYAKQHGGQFVLRIEDTDAARNRPEWTDGIITALAWVGIATDDPTFEGPYFQSQRTDRHRAAVRTMLAAEHAYHCDCTRDDVIARAGNPHAGYDGYCRGRGLPPGDGRAVRFRIPGGGTTKVLDVIRGEPTFDNANLEDFVIQRGDGSATFLLANVVDDIDMRITHVIRGEEHLPNTPKQQLLWLALGATPPVWAHLPILVNEKRQKLSKRRDKLALESYRAEGYLPDAMRNYLMLLGWAPGDGREILPWDELSAQFRLEQIKPSPAFFDEKKLRAFNGEYIRALSVADFIDACQPWLTAPDGLWPAEGYDPAVFATVASLAQTRIAVLSEVTSMVDFLFVDRPGYDQRAWSDVMKHPAAEILHDAREAYRECPFTVDELKARLEAIGSEHGVRLGKAQAPIRVAVTGRSVGLPLFESLTVLGRDRTIARLDAAIEQLTVDAGR